MAAARMYVCVCECVRNQIAVGRQRKNTKCLHTFSNFNKSFCVLVMSQQLSSVGAQLKY